MKTICKLMSQLLISIVFNLGIVTMCAGQFNFSDDFESFKPLYDFEPMRLEDEIKEIIGEESQIF